MAHQIPAALVAIFLYVAGVSGSGPDSSDIGIGDSTSSHLQPQRSSADVKRAELPVKHRAWYGAGDVNWKRAPNGLGTAGFHSNVFSHGFGAFYPVKRMAVTLKKRRPEMDSSGFYGDTFNGGMGYFDTMKRRPEMDSSGFYGDTFNGGMGYFDTMKRRPEMDSSGFYGDTFNDGMGYFDTMKRRPEMDSSGFYGDTFNDGMGYFDTMKRIVTKKRRPEMDSSGFHGDVFSNGFGYFDTMKRQATRAKYQHSTDSAESKLNSAMNLQQHRTQRSVANAAGASNWKREDGRLSDMHLNRPSSK